MVVENSKQAVNYTVASSMGTDSPIMLINKHIGYDPEEGQGIDGADFQRELLQLDEMGYKSITVWINSPGGVVTDGFNIFSAILKSKTPVDTYNAGMCASIAGAIFMAGRKRTMADYASLMMHNPGGTEDKKMLGAVKDGIVTMLSSKAQIAGPEVEFLMNRTTWLNAAECFAKGFCTDIEVTSDHNKKRMSILNTADASTWRASWKEANLILNSILSPIENIEMKKVTNKLGLNEAASEENIVTAIDGITNRATTAEGKIVTMATEAANLTNKIAELTTENATLKADKEAGEKLVKDAETATELTAVTNLVKGAIASGKFKVDATNTEATFIETGVKLGSTELKKLVDGMTINKVANKIVTSGTGVAAGAGGLSNYAAQKMAELQAKIAEGK